MTRQLDKVYRLDHAVTKTQKVILSAFGMDWNHVKYRAENISMIIPGLFEPPIRTLRATIPENESHIFR